jgi:hypothetical protein
MYSFICIYTYDIHPCPIPHVLPKARAEAAAEEEAAEKRRRRELVSQNLAPSAAPGEGDGEDAAHAANAAVSMRERGGVV